MAGELVPLVMVPRFTTLAGTKPSSPVIGFTTVGMDVTEFESAIINFWRGEMVATGGTPAFKVTCEESTDQNSWSTCTGTTVDTVVAEDTEVRFTPTLNKRWFRVRMKVEGTAPVVTCWAVGYLVQRQR